MVSGFGWLHASGSKESYFYHIISTISYYLYHNNSFSFFKINSKNFLSVLINPSSKERNFFSKYFSKLNLSRTLGREILSVLDIRTKVNSFFNASKTSFVSS